MLGINVDGITTMSKTDKIIYEANCYVTGVEQLDKMIIALEKNSYVTKVERTMR